MLFAVPLNIFVHRNGPNKTEFTFFISSEYCLFSKDIFLLNIFLYQTTSLVVPDYDPKGEFFLLPLTPIIYPYIVCYLF